MKTLSSWPLDLCGRSSSWRLKEFRVFFEKLFDSGRSSGAKRQQWSCKCLSPSAPAWVREQQQGGGGKGKRGTSQIPAVGAEGPPSPPQGGAPSDSSRAGGAAAFEPRHFSRVPNGYQNASSAVELAAPLGPSLEELGWVSVSWLPTDRRMLLLLAALRQLRRHPTWARLPGDLETGT